VIKNVDQEKLYYDHNCNDKIIFNSFCELLSRLSEKNSFLITIRPHPAEKIEAYLALAEKYRNVVVDNVTSLTSQLMTHDCVIHDGCTTAIEATSIGLPAFGLRPESVTYDYGKLANLFSLNFSDADKLVSYLEEASPLDFEFHKNCDFDIEDYIANWADFSSNNEIIKVVESFSIAPSNMRFLLSIYRVRSKFKSGFKNFSFELLNFFRFSYYSGCLKLFIRIKEAIEYKSILNIKFPCLDVKDIAGYIDDLSLFDDNVDSAAKISIKKLDSRSFYISGKNNND
jgi:hypothetical protein